MRDRLFLSVALAVLTLLGLAIVLLLVHQAACLVRHIQGKPAAREPSRFTIYARGAALKARPPLRRPRTLDALLYGATHWMLTPYLWLRYG